MSSCEVLRATLLGQDQPMSKRIRCIFLLKQIGNQEALEAIAAAILDPSALLAHDAAFALGQMRNPAAIPFLNDALANKELDSIVRHEAAEALGAIADPASIAVLESYLNDVEEVVHTCQLAIDNIRFEVKKREEQASGDAPADGTASKFYSVDPAPAIDDDSVTTEELEKTLCDEALPLFERYRAMFTLRNRGSEDCVLALAKGLKTGPPLLQHEIAYVMGQMQHEASVPALLEALRDESLHVMTRHEAAEALGNIGSSAVTDILEEFRKDSDVMVRESCEVALDLTEYWLSNDDDGGIE